MLVGTILIVLVSRGIGDAAAASESWARAQSAFQAGLDRRAEGRPSRDEFARAARIFADLEQDTPSAALYLNLGKAHYLAGDLPEAIVAFRRGLRLEPSHRNLHDCLRHARADVGLVPKADAPVLASPSLEIQHWIELGWLEAVFVVSLMAGCWLLPASIRRRAWPGMVAAGLALALTLVSFVCHRQARRELSAAVQVIREEVPLRTGNGTSYPPHHDVARLPRGLEVERLTVRGGWCRIRIPGGATGWVPRDALIDDR